MMVDLKDNLRVDMMVVRTAAPWVELWADMLAI